MAASICVAIDSYGDMETRGLLFAVMRWDKGREARRGNIGRRNIY